MTPDKPEPPSPSTDTPEQEQEAAPPKQPMDHGMSLLDFVNLVPGSRISAVTLPNGERWELDEKGNKTVFKPQ